jgi:hypothetical protein
MIKGRQEKTGTDNHRWSKVEITLWVHTGLDRLGSESHG